MAITNRIIDASPEQVYAVLADGWTYSDWVVGTAHIRGVDRHWPAPGAKIYHKAGPWPLSLHDSTVCESAVPNAELVLRPRLWPMGEATVTIRLEPLPDGRTLVVISEHFVAGPLQWVQNKINDLVMHRRNVEGLRRLADIVERRPAALGRAARDQLDAPATATAPRS
ncbi:SRPBCC family protein [Pilimelia columellifera]|uniref:SRPBCC family protein n=1 Tax=Pilimelia columellifera subsp. columellifera TaxID=706583 RepID=A0ABP6ADA9_9ACTN